MSSINTPKESTPITSVIMSTHDHHNYHHHHHREDTMNPNSFDQVSDCSSNYEPKKKRFRAKLDHLSPTEKLARRKMKNRIAAQTARDRKRAKIDHLEEENRKLRLENEILKSQLKNNTDHSSNQMVDSGISDNNETPETNSSGVVESTNMDLLMVPNHSSSGNNNNPSSPGGSYTSGIQSGTSSLPESQDYLDSVVGETDENSLIDDILQLQSSIFCTSGNEASLESAELISEPQQQVQEASYQSRLVENSAGWTSIQLMLLLMISRVHRMYSWKINCCAITPNGEDENNKPCSNLYDYILQTRCIDFRRAAEAIISNKNNVRKQRLVALEFVYIYLYNSRLINSIPTALIQQNGSEQIN